MRTKMFCLAFVLALSQWATPGLCMQQAFLVQNSGWMEPFYSDSSSAFKALVAQTIESVSAPDDAIFVLAFSQSTQGNESPRTVFQGAVGPGIRQALSQLTLARKGTGTALADTDFKEAVVKTISGTFKTSPGIIWIFTNNKNSPNNSPETMAHNREFYNLIHNQPSILRTLAFPLAMPVVGKSYKASGLMVYALAYGQQADSHLQAMLDNGRIAKVFTQSAAQLKPLDRDAIRILPGKVLDAPNITAKLGADKRTLLLDIDVSSRRAVVQLVAGLENLFYPYEIESASISAQVATSSGEMPLPIMPDVIHSLAPGQHVDARIAIPVDVTLPSPWSLQGLLQFGRSLVVPAVMVVQLNDQKLLVDKGFRARMQEIFPGDPLPDVFTPPSGITSSVGRIPMVLRVNYPVYPLLLAMLFLGMLGAGAFFLTRRGTVASIDVIVDGTPRRVSLQRFSSIDIYSDQSLKIAVLKRGIGAPVVQSVAEGHSVSIAR